MIEFVVASHDKKVFDENILRSNVYANYIFNVQRGFTNVPQAYNSAPIRKETKYVVYVHEDVYMPEGFALSLDAAIRDAPPDWGVLGAAGVNYKEGKRTNHGFIFDRGKLWGSDTAKTEEVETLDELLIVTRGDLTFDPQFALHFYGADACMQARARGQKCYAFPSGVHHNSTLEVGERTPEFWRTRELFKAKWKDYLPIQTTCNLVE